MSTSSPIQVTDVEIHFGTMFGSAERYAQALAHDISSHHQVQVHVHDLDAFDEETFASADRLTASRLFVFIVSTHFAGAPSPSAERFRDWLNYLITCSSANAELGANSAVTAASKSPKPRAQRHWFDFFTGLAVLKPFRRHALPFTGMQFAVFGIGDSVYLTYNAMGKFVDAKLKRLGATRFHVLGLGDCSNDLERSFKDWGTDLRLKLPPIDTSVVVPSLAPSLASSSSGRRTIRKSFSASRLVFPSSVQSAPEEEKYDNRDALNVPDDSTFETAKSSISDPDHATRDLYGRLVRLRFGCRILKGCAIASVQLHFLQSAPSVEIMAHASSPGPRTPRIALFDDKPFADIIPVECIGGAPSASKSPSSRQSVLGINVATRSATFRVRLLNPEAVYTTVSTLAIFPQNSLENVEKLARAFAYDLDTVIELCAHATHQSQLPFPTPCTVRTALTEFLEICSVTRDFVRIAAGYASDADERGLLSDLASTDAFSTRIQDQHQGVLDILAMTPTLKIPLEVFVNIVPTIRPRYFTIASSPQVSPRDLDFAVLLGRPNQPQGLAVSYFETMLASPSGSRAPLRGFISSSRFQFRDDGVSPMILIASGVGFAAMRAVLMDRIAGWLRGQSAGNHSSTRLKLLPTHILFLGTANEDSVVFGNDLRRWEQQMVVKVHYAFSNDRSHPRRYVQDVVAARIDEVVQVVQSSSSSRVFVCGRTAMVRRIREIFEADQVRRGSAWFDTIHKSGRFTEEGYN